MRCLKRAPQDCTQAGEKFPRGKCLRQIIVGSDFQAGDSIRFVRALANILRNAVRYAGERGPIEVSAAQKNERVEISITDSGSGIPEEALDRVFTPFYRLDNARDRRTGGRDSALPSSEHASRHAVDLWNAATANRPVCKSSSA